MWLTYFILAVCVSPSNAEATPRINTACKLESRRCNHTHTHTHTHTNGNNMKTVPERLNVPGPAGRRTGGWWWRWRWRGGWGGWRRRSSSWPQWSDGNRRVIKPPPSAERSTGCPARTHTVTDTHTAHVQPFITEEPVFIISHGLTTGAVYEEANVNTSWIRADGISEPGREGSVLLPPSPVMLVVFNLIRFKPPRELLPSLRVPSPRGRRRFRAESGG